MDKKNDMSKFSVLLFLILTICSCAKKKKCKVYKFTAYKYYQGSLDVSKYATLITITELDSGIKTDATLIGADKTLVYPVHIHSQSSTTPYGYSGSPLIFIPHIHHAQTSTMVSKEFTFQQFTENFKGFLVIHDPYIVINDTTTHVIFGKIGAWQ
jgi:hypothetical protein